MSVEEFYKKRLEEQVKEAKEVVREYRKVYKKEVTEDILRIFAFFLMQRNLCLTAGMKK